LAISDRQASLYLLVARAHDSAVKIPRVLDTRTGWYHAGEISVSSRHTCCEHSAVITNHVVGAHAFEILPLLVCSILLSLSSLYLFRDTSLPLPIRSIILPFIPFLLILYLFIIQLISYIILVFSWINQSPFFFYHN